MSKCSNVLRVSLGDIDGRRFAKGFLKYGFAPSAPNGFEHVKMECVAVWGVDANVEPCDITSEVIDGDCLLLKYDTNGVGPVKWLNLLSNTISFRCSGFNQTTGYYYCGSSNNVLVAKNIDDE